MVCPYCFAPQQEGALCRSCGSILSGYHQADHHLPPGTVLADRYQVGAVLGEGGFGITYLGLDTRLGVKVAVKEHFPRDKVSRTRGSLQLDVHMGYGDAPFQESKAKFLEEARTLTKLSGIPQIINVRDFFEANGTAYIVMDYVEGITLSEWIRREGGRVPAVKILGLMDGIFVALEQIHALGLIHRDISPDNMMLENGKLRLLDFGIAREVGRRTETLTMTLRHGYAPVEQYQPMGQGPWTDVYALSATIYFCVTGVKPPSALERICGDRLVMPSQLGAQISHKQEQVLLYGMGVRPRRRFQSAAAMRKEMYNL